MKRCSDCGERKPDSDYHSNLRRPDGLAFYCKPCAALRSEKSRRGRGIKERRWPAEPVGDGLKWCLDCDRPKPLEDFPKNRNTGSGRAPYCKPCLNVRGRASRNRHGGDRNYHLRRRYGITAAQADMMLSEQGGLCAICRLAPAAHVDHDHATGKVRGLLCFNCNGGLGQFKDHIGVVEAAAGYLRSHSASGGAAPAALASSSLASSSTKPGWPRVIELYPYRGVEIRVKRWQHPIGA